MTTRPTLFTWGYHGWGNATPQLLEAVDAVEQGRGFAPPVFVDTRIRRNVRARGFNGPGFERFLGPGRHHWMKSLGNRFIKTRTGPPIQIVDPAAAIQLLDLGLQEADKGRRLLFFCGCQFPRTDGETSCHRDTVADLVLAQAQQRNQPVEVIEWPGGEPTQLDLEVTSSVFKALQRGRATIPLGVPPVPTLPVIAGLPWGSVVTITCGNQSLSVLSGPATFQRGAWMLPVFQQLTPGVFNSHQVEAEKLRCRWGLEGRLSASHVCQ